MMSLGEVFSVRAIADLAGPRVYARGVGYHADGRVEPDTGTDRRLEATVRGSVPYSVELWVDRDSPGWSCSCPAAEDGSFCKHCVAVALLFARGSDPVVGAMLEPVEAPHGSDISSHVAGLSRERLVEIVIEQCETDWQLRE